MITPLICRCDGIGRRSGLKIHRWRQRTGSSPVTGTTSEQALYRLLRLFSKVRARSRRCSSFPNHNRLRWVAIWFRVQTWELEHLSCCDAPHRSKLCIACSDFFQKPERAHAATPPSQITTACAGLRFGFGCKPGSWSIYPVAMFRTGASFVSLATSFFILFQNASCVHSAAPRFQIEPASLGFDLVLGTNPEADGIYIAAMFPLAASATSLAAGFSFLKSLACPSVCSFPPTRSSPSDLQADFGG